MRDRKGVETLEVVQKFYETIKQKPRKAQKVVKDLEALCPLGKFTHSNQAVTTLVYQDSLTNERHYRTARVS